MISQKLFNEFQVLEMLVFPKWQEANEKQKLKIEEELGRYEGQIIIDEIEKEANQKNFKGSEYEKSIQFKLWKRSLERI